MKDYRKLILGLVYIVACTAIGLLHVHKGPTFDGLGLGELFAGMATGVSAIVYGNVKEHEHAASISIAQKNNPTP